MFLGTDMDLSTSQPAIASNQVAQSNAAAQEQQAKGGIKPTSKGISGIDIGSRYLTESQKSSQRQ